MADADFVGSALLTALIVYVPAVAGAVYLPVDVMVPAEADQITPVLVVPVTLARNCC